MTAATQQAGSPDNEPVRVNHTVRNIVIALIVVAVMSAGRVVERGDVCNVFAAPQHGDQAVHRHGIRFGHRLDHLRVLGRRCAGARLSRGLSRSSDVIDFGTAADPIGYEDAIAAAVRGRQGGDAMSPWSHAYDIAGHQTDWTVIRKSTRR